MTQEAMGLIRKFREERNWDQFHNPKDVAIYCIYMAYACGQDMDEIVREKMRKNAEKDPVEKAYGSREKYTQLG